MMYGVSMGADGTSKVDLPAPGVRRARRGTCARRRPCRDRCGPERDRRDRRRAGHRAGPLACVCEHHPPRRSRESSSCWPGSGCSCCGAVRPGPPPPSNAPPPSARRARASAPRCERSSAAVRTRTRGASSRTSCCAPTSARGARPTSWRGSARAITAGADPAGLLRDEIVAVLGPDEDLHLPSDRLGVVLVVGVNGSGKTTTIGKLAATPDGRGSHGEPGGRRHVPGGGERAARRCGPTAPARTSCRSSAAPTPRRSPSTP